MGMVENMQHLESYGGVSRGKFEGQLLKNGKCSPVVVPNFKRRKVSAVRTFPEGCGRNAPQIHARPTTVAGSVGGMGEKSAGRYKSEAALEANSIQVSVTGVESQSPQSLQASVHIGVLKCSNNLESNVEKQVVLSNIVEVPGLMNDEPEGIGLPMALDNAGSAESLYPSNNEVSELPKNLQIPETTTPTEDMVCLKSSPPPTLPIKDDNIVGKTVSWNYPPRRKISALRDFPSLCGSTAPCLSKEDCMKALASSKSTSLGQERSDVEEKLMNGTVGTYLKEIGDNVQDEGNLKRKFEKIVSRNLGDKVKPEFQKDGIKEITKQLDSGMFSELRVDLEDKIQETITAACGSDVDWSNHSSHTYKKKIDIEVGKGGSDRKMGKDVVVYDTKVRGVEGKVGNKIMLHNKNKSVQKKYSVFSGSKTKFHAKDVCFDLEMDRVVVQGLMAPPNCSLRQRKAPCGSDANRLNHSSHTYSKKSDIETGKEIIVYGGEVGGLDRKMGKDIMVYDLEVRGAELKVGNEIMLHNKNKSVQKKSSKTQFHAEDIGLDLKMDRVVIQGLMAAPNCPWGQQKEGSKPDRAGKQGYIGKIHDISEQRKSKSIFKTKNGRTEKLGGQLLKRKFSPIRKAAYCDIGELVVRDEVDFIEDYEEHEDFHVTHRSHEFNVSLPPFGQSSSSAKGDDHDAIVTRNKVRETLRIFQGVCRKLLQEEEAKPKQGGNGLRRVDLLAAKIVKSKGKYVNIGKQILGPVPGVEVGDEFHYRVELAIVGLHRPLQGGIDYLKQGAELIATSVVASGGYADDLDDSDTLIYMGSGGNINGGDRPPEDQKLERGNLALTNSARAKSPVRVIRGLNDARAKVVGRLTYDGLYLVDKYWQELGPHGKLVFQFHLVRIPGQPELAWNEVKKSKKLKIREGICVNDISQGKELIPICAINTINDESPSQFKYISSMIYPNWCNPIPPRGCGCIDGCSESERCYCAVKNGLEIPYNHNGAIVEAKPIVYECGPSCKCPPSCHNRVSQHGIKFQLEIFKTVSRGWGVRSINSIPSGSFICEYLGELLDDKEAEQRTGSDEYLFDIGQNYIDQTLCGGLSKPMDPQSGSCEVVEDSGFTIDAAQYGNVGRFINHSCSPNLYAQNVLYDHEDRRMPHIMLFAAENIPPLQELTYHYNYTIDQVYDSNGNIKKKSCYCGSLECEGRMY